MLCLFFNRGCLSDNLFSFTEVKREKVAAIPSYYFEHSPFQSFSLVFPISYLSQFLFTSCFTSWRWYWSCCVIPVLDDLKTHLPQITSQVCCLQLLVSVCRINKEVESTNLRGKVVL